MSSPLIALVDVGKTNAKLSLIEPQAGVELWSASRANAVVRTPIARQLDVTEIERWLVGALREAPHKERVNVIVPVAHGAAAVLVGANDEILLAPDYEDPCYEAISPAYERMRDPYERTFSPTLPNGLNLGRQWFYLEERHPQLFARAEHLLLYPQFWAWRISGVMASEVTSLGCHSDLWRAREMSYSGLARSRNWTHKLPPTRFAGDALGCVRPGPATAAAINPQCKVVCGMHDSNASYLRFLLGRPRNEPFTVVSSGTWTVVMANRAELSGLREERDMLASVDAFGSPVATARYMGGREYDAIAGGASEQPDLDALAAVLEKQAVALPSFASGGPFQGRTGRLLQADRLATAERAALATLYTALMTELLIESLGATGDVLIDGPLAGNRLFGPLLRTFGHAGDVRLSASSLGGARSACYLAGFPLAAQEPMQAAEPLRLPQLHEYRHRWRELTLGPG